MHIEDCKQSKNERNHESQESRLSELYNTPFTQRKISRHSRNYKKHRHNPSCHEDINQSKYWIWWSGIHDVPWSNDERSSAMVEKNRAHRNDSQPIKPIPSFDSAAHVFTHQSL